MEHISSNRTVPKLLRKIIYIKIKALRIWIKFDKLFRENWKSERNTKCISFILRNDSTEFGTGDAGIIGALNWIKHKYN